MKYSKYSLTPKVDLNRFSDKSLTREGVIFKLNNQYFDYHPWLEFGDLAVDNYIEQVKSSGVTEIMSKSFDLWQAREKIPHMAFLNHKLNALAAVSKIKYVSRAHFLDFLSQMDSNSRVRVDFNNMFTNTEVENLWASLTCEQRNKIDYFEDPCPKDETWRDLEKLGITIASDRNTKDGVGHSIDIFKPNVDLMKPSSRRQIFSSYMGHDLGRYICYLELMQSGDLTETHGIDTPSIYENQLDLFKGNDAELTVDQCSLKKLEESLDEISWSSL